MRVTTGLLCLMLLAGIAEGQDAPFAKVQARAALLMDADTGEVLRQKNPDLLLPPASTTKIMTAWLLARSLPPDTPVTVSANAAQTPETALGMKAGQTFSARDLLHAMLLASANDASIAAAEAMDGSVSAFVQRMNAEAQQAGAMHTRFTNPNGLPDPQHLSTARDLALITRQALQNPAFAAAVRARTYTVPARNGNPPQTLINTDTLLTTRPKITGVKTGWTREAGYCFVGSATQGGRHYITVALNSPDWQADTLALLASAPGSGLPGAGRPAGTVGAEQTQNDQNKAAASFRQPTPNTQRPLLPLLALFSIFCLLYLMRGIVMPKLRFPFPSKFSFPSAPSPLSFASYGVKFPAASSPIPDETNAVFPYLMSLLPFSRGAGVEWLDAVFANPLRLLEPTTRFRAAALLDANADYDLAPLRNLQAAPQANLRIAAAELLRPFDPKLSEETLLEAADAPEIALDVRVEALRVLAETSGNRHEVLFRQILLREGMPAAALALRGLPCLTEETKAALQQALKATDQTGNTKTVDLKAIQQRAVIACVLAEHGNLTPEDAAEHCKNVSPSVLLGVLSGENNPPRTEWAVSQITALALRGNPAAIKPLLDINPQSVRQALEAENAVEENFNKNHPKWMALKWLLFREGDVETLRRTAEAGDETARTALQLSLSHHANLAETEPSVLLAAAQIVSLRQGFGHYPPEQIQALFQASASGEPDAATLAQYPELEPLARAYAHPEAHQAVQNALHTPDGPEQLAAELTRQSGHPAFQNEMQFWADKTDRATRLPLVRALNSIPSNEAQRTVAARIADHCPQVRRFALRQKAEGRGQKTENAESTKAAPAELDAAA